MDLESPLRKLENRYRGSLSATVAAKAHSLALEGEPSATSVAVERAKSRWQELECKKSAIAARMGEIEAMDPDATA